MLTIAAHGNGYELNTRGIFRRRKQSGAILAFVQPRVVSLNLFDLIGAPILSKANLRPTTSSKVSFAESVENHAIRIEKPLSEAALMAERWTSVVSLTITAASDFHGEVA